MEGISEKLKNIQIELKAPKVHFNKFGNYNYRNLDDILTSLKPLLDKYDCFVQLSDEPIFIEGWHYIKATASLKDSKSQISVTAMAREDESLKGMTQAQITGAVSSYARKYALNGLLAIDDTKDADSFNDGSMTTKKATQKTDKTSAIADLKTSQTLAELIDKFKLYPSLNSDKEFIEIASKLKTKFNNNNGKAK